MICLERYAGLANIPFLWRGADRDGADCLGFASLVSSELRGVPFYLNHDEICAYYERHPELPSTNDEVLEMTTLLTMKRRYTAVPQHGDLLVIHSPRGNGLGTYLKRSDDGEAAVALMGVGGSMVFPFARLSGRSLRGVFDPSPILDGARR